MMMADRQRPAPGHRPRSSGVIVFSRVLVFLARLITLAAVALVMTGCAGQSQGAAPATAAGPAVATTRSAATPRAASTRAAAPVPTRLTSVKPLPTTTDAGLEPRTVIRVFSDARQRSITLYYGRGLGRSGDWGWAHILGKHLYGEWRDGGPITTFDVIGVTTAEGVVEAIQRSLQDPDPETSDAGRRLYRAPAGGDRYEILTVVGGDGAIITAYPDRASRGR